MRTVATRAISLLMLALVVFVMVLVPSSCTNSENDETIGETFTIGGVTQKGPFLTGSSVFIQELDELLVPTGLAYQTYTTDDQGSFGLDSELQSSLVEISITGFYFNEVTGVLSDAQITLKGLADLSQTTNANVNVLTSVTLDRIRALIGEGLDFETASEQAQGEVLGIFGIDASLVAGSFSELDLTNAGVENAALLYVSALLQIGNSEAELSLLMSEIGFDLQTDGSLDDPALSDEIAANAENVDLQSVIDNLVGYYDDLGEVIDTPDVETFILDMDETSPLVIATNVLDQTYGVSIYTMFIVDFDEEVDLGSVEGGGIVLQDMAGTVTGSFELTGTAVTFTADAPLAYESQYELLITTIVTDLAGNALAEPVTITFMTEVEPDLIAPALINALPHDGALDVSIEQAVVLTFSEELDSSSVTSDQIWITDGTNLVASVIEPLGVTVMITPELPLAHETQYWIMATTGLTDLAGNHLVGDITLTFSTELAPLPPPPPPPPVVEALLIEDVTPHDGADDVSTKKDIKLTFSEFIDPTSLTETSLQLFGPDGVVAGRLEIDEGELKFKPSRHLSHDTRYEIHLLDLVGMEGAVHDELEVFTFFTKDHKDHDHDTGHDKGHGKGHDHHDH